MANAINYKDPIQLVHKTDRRVIVQFPKGINGGEVIFGKEAALLASAMKEGGIAIPLNARAAYPELKNNQFAIYLSDPSFGKAFYEVYFTHAFKPPENYQWEKI